jgi:L-fucose isomerase-like protein
LKDTKFLVFQDNPGQGAQASIFKRFYWWEDECTQRMARKFGVTIVRDSFKDLAAQAKDIPDAQAQAAWKDWNLATEGLTDRSIRSAIKLYLAVRRRLDEDSRIRAVGINCLNESHFCDSTPCLAWAMLFEQRGVVWGCEADTLSMLTQYVLGKSLGAPLMLTNLYPFLLGQAALRHERIEKFPDVPDDSANYVLVAHCGYVGLMPPSFATSWTLRPKVLAIVDANAVAIDALFPTGDVTLAKLHARLDRMTVATGQLTGYVEYPGSDCRRGGVIRLGDGHRLMSSLASHHYVLVSGRHRADIENLGKVFDLEIQPI